MSLHPSHIGGVDMAAAATFKSTSTHKKSSGTSFSAQLKDATGTAETGASKKAPSGETTKAVDGHKYADILTGPRKGLFLNTGHNTRAGEAFVMVRKNGREYHIYGTGAHRTVIGLKPDAEKKTDTSTSTTDTSTTTPTGTTDTGKINTDTSTTSGG
jgi:hypothetical protein